MDHDDLQVVKDSRFYAPILASPDPDRPLSVVCDASDFSIGTDLLHTDVDGRERVTAFDFDRLLLLKRTILFMTRSYLLCNG